MRTIAPLEVRVQRFGVWRMSVIGLTLAACAALAAWWSAQPLPRASSLSTGVAAGMVAVLAAMLGLVRQRPLTLRWDGQCWHLARDGEVAAPGRLELAIDLGAWLLLRFVPGVMPPKSGWQRSCWIALQRRGLESQWHALRVTLYGAHPDLDASGGANDA